MADDTDAPDGASDATASQEKERRARKVARQVEYQRRRLADATPEQAAEIRKRQAEYAARWRARHPEKAKEVLKASSKKARFADPDGCRAKANAIREKNKAGINERRRERYAADPSRALAQIAASYQRHKEVRLADSRAWRAANLERARESGKRWREANPGRNNELAKAWARANPERAKAKIAAWRAANPDYLRDRLRYDPAFKIVMYLRARLSIALKRARTTKTSNSLALIGCSPKFLLAYLAERFTAGMSWDNYGEWHIDHIRPCCTFDLSDPDQQRAAFHYTNLRPLWAAENLARPRSKWRQEMAA